VPEVSEGNFNDWAPRLFVLPPYKSNVLMAPISLRIFSSLSLFICGVHDRRLPVRPKRQRLAGAYECSLMSQHLLSINKDGVLGTHPCILDEEPNKIRGKIAQMNPGTAVLGDRF
jgi:hypothetical protein